MRHHKGLGVGHIYTCLKPDDGILLSDDATTTHPTHHLEASDEPPFGTRPSHPERCPSLNNTNPQTNSSIPAAYVEIDTGPGDNILEGSDEDEGDGDEDEDEDEDERSVDENEGSDDDLDIEDIPDPLDLDYEDDED